MIGIGADPAAAGVIPATVTSAVQQTGRVVRAQMTPQGIALLSAGVHLASGDRLVVELVSSGTNAHDLVTGSARSPRIAPGTRTELDAGLIGASIQDNCSVAGHRQMGMV